MLGNWNAFRLSQATCRVWSITDMCRDRAQVFGSMHQLDSHLVHTFLLIACLGSSNNSLLSRSINEINAEFQCYLVSSVIFLLKKDDFSVYLNSNWEGRIIKVTAIIWLTQVFLLLVVLQWHSSCT